jgi:carbon storage regulator CsrA
VLVLTRKLQQQIKIGDLITVTVLRVKGNTVRIGVEAPREVRVIRGELPKTPESAESAKDGESAEHVPIVTLTVNTDTGAAEVDSEDGKTTAGETSAGSRDSSPVRAGRLPLRRISNRHGVAPLKRIVAACALSAK